MTIDIRRAEAKDLPKYTELLQKTYEDAYVNVVIGLTKECFSQEIFNSPDTQKYLVSNLINNDKQACYLAFDQSVLVGSISIIEKEDEYELRGFYVAKEYQGHGIGKRLWKKVIKDVKGKDITLDIYEHNKSTIEIYKKWGFVVDHAKGQFFRHWPEWPENVKARCLYMRYHQD